MNRVVITGLGIYSCIGKDLAQVRDSLYAGISGIVVDPGRTEFGFRSPLTGTVEKPNLKGKIDRRMRIGMADECEYAYISTVEALADAGIDKNYLETNEVGILFGNDSTAQAVVDATELMKEKKDTSLIGSGAIFQSMNSTVTMNLSVIFKLKGINFTISGACASGSHAIGLGYLFIKHGYQHMVVCGGAQEINAYSMGSFDALGAFSVRTDDCTKASRPFDRDRDGLVPSGGSATVILESYESAVRRGAKIYGEIVGYGFSSNGEHISQPNVDGAVRSLEMAIRESGLQLRDIDYINAHATSTPIGDMNEAIAIDQVFGSVRPLVSSTKSMTGHECWMAGASEIVYSTLMMRDSFIAPNINFENPDEYSARLNIAPNTVEKDIDCYLSNSFGFGGTNSTLIIKKLNN